MFAGIGGACPFCALAGAGGKVCGPLPGAGGANCGIGPPAPGGYGGAEKCDPGLLPGGYGGADGLLPGEADGLLPPLNVDDDMMAMPLICADIESRVVLRDEKWETAGVRQHKQTTTRYPYRGTHHDEALTPGSVYIEKL